MMTAQEAKKNVELYEVTLFQKTLERVMTQLENISTIIEFHSKNGNRQLVFSPYNKSAFYSDEMLNTAQKIFGEILKRNGYEVIENDCQKNFLKVQW